MTEKRYNVWDIDGTIFLEDHKEGSYHIGQAGNVDINCLNDIANRLNDLTDENEQLKERIKKHMEIELLKSEDYANCHNCKNDRSVHDGVALDGMCAIKGLMNLDGYFDTEYHSLPTGTLCPCWELEK